MVLTEDFNSKKKTQSNRESFVSGIQLPTYTSARFARFFSPKLQALTPVCSNRFCSFLHKTSTAQPSGRKLLPFLQNLSLI